MLEYTKLILKKVSFDRFLFEKELRKSLNYLFPHEVKELLAWVKVHFSEYSNILDSVSNYS